MGSYRKFVEINFENLTLNISSYVQNGGQIGTKTFRQLDILMNNVVHWSKEQMPDNLGALGDSIGPLVCYLGLPRRFPGCTRGFKRFFRMFPRFTYEVP